MSWELGSFLLLGVALALGLVWYERSRPPARVLGLVAALAALAVVGRLVFAPFPNVKPTTDIVLLSGYALGGAPGFAVGSVAALVSNIFLSHGPWTPWQMAAWGAMGLFGGALGWVVRRRERDGTAAIRDEQRELGRWSLAAACGIAGLGFGLVMDLYLWTLGGQHTLAAYLVLSGRSLPFNLAHAIGNVVFCLVIGPPLVRALRRYRQRFEVVWRPSIEGGARSVASVVLVGAALLAAALASTLAWPPHARADSSATRAAHYLLGAQGCDGGFGGFPRQRSSQMITGWAGLGLAAAGYNARDVKRNGRSVLDYMRRNAGSIRDTGAIERTVLLLRAAGVSPHSFAGRDLVRELRAKRSDDGSFDGFVNWTAYGVLALRASGETEDSSLVQGSVSWLLGAQNSDGGFGISRGAQSETEYTAVVLEALSTGGKEGSEAARRGVEYLRGAQDAGGGFAKERGHPPNAQATAWVVRGLVAAGHGGSSVVERALAYLRSLQAPDGSIRYSSSSGQTPVWVTGDVLPALMRRSFPLDQAARRQLRDRACRRPDQAASPEQEPEPERGNGGKGRDRGEPADRPPAEVDAAGGAGEGSGSRRGGRGPKGSGFGASAAKGLAGAAVPFGGLALRPPAGTLPAEAAVARTPLLQPDPSSARPTGSEPRVGGPGPAETAWRALSDSGHGAADQKKADSSGHRTPAKGGIAAVIIATVAVLVAVGTAGAARLRRLWSSTAVRRIWPPGRLAALARRRTP